MQEAEETTMKNTEEPRVITCYHEIHGTIGSHFRRQQFHRKIVPLFPGDPVRHWVKGQTSLAKAKQTESRCCWVLSFALSNKDRNDDRVDHKGNVER